MIISTITIKNKLGLHARASAKFVATTSQFLSKITVNKYNTASINGKSIMAIIMLAAKQGDTLQLTIDGPDEEALEQAIIKLVNNLFGECE